jgi:hypothetical protein
MTPNVKLTIERDGKTAIVLVRQMPHDAPVGKKFRYGSGKAWIVRQVEAAS